jgi:hypothetical protein
MGLPERRSATVPAARRTGGPPAINPNLILGVRFILTSLVCALALATAIMAILVVDVSVQAPPGRGADASREAATARR